MQRGGTNRLGGPARSLGSVKIPRDDALWREIAERADRPLGVVVLAKVFNNDTGLGQRPESLAVQAFIAKSGVERFNEAILLYRRRKDPGKGAGLKGRLRSI